MEKQELPRQANPTWIEEESATPFVDQNEVAIEANRYLFFANDLINPRRKRLVKKLRWGGEELEPDYKCFSITKNHVWRNMIVPMTSGQYLLDEQLVPDEARGTAVTTVGSFGRTQVQYATRVHPGLEIGTLLFGKSSLPTKGLVEIKALRDVEWRNVKEQGIQRHFFPDWDDYKTGVKTMPKTLSWTRERIQAAMRDTSSETLISIGEDMLLSCELSYAWGIDYLKRETTLVKTPPAPGSSFVYSYSDLAEQMFEFLEQQRQDYLKQDYAALAGSVSFADNTKQEEYDAMLAKMQATQDKIVELLATQMGVTPPVVSQPKTVLCTAVKKNSEPCGAPPKEGTELCVFHTVKDEV